MAKQRNNRVIKYKKSRNINIGIVIFSITFIYIIINITLYFSKDRINIYEVSEGTSSGLTNNYYTGLILRNEEVTNASKTGYLNFYVRESSQVAVGTNLYTIDESGKISAMIETASENGSLLNEDSVKLIKEEIYKFTTSYNPMDFSSIYSFKYGLDSIIIDNYNLANLNNINFDSIEITKAEKSGIVLYYIDHYEEINTDNIKKENFNQADYKRLIIKSNDLIEKDTPIFKTITSEDWYLIIPLTEDEAKKYKNEDTLHVQFSKDGLTANCLFEILKKDDGYYGKLSFNKYNVRYLYDRFLDIKIIDEKIEGLKIPKTSVVNKDFYIIPKEFASSGGNNNTSGFLKEVIKDGSSTIEFKSPTIYYQDDEFYYVEQTAFESGDVIIMDDSASRYTINEVKSLQGVYNINNGYTNFKIIEIQAETDEYYIIKKNTPFGLVSFDQIVLNANKVKENQVIYQ